LNFDGWDWLGAIGNVVGVCIGGVQAVYKVGVAIRNLVIICNVDFIAGNEE
jgi:hypothetical protein